MTDVAWTSCWMFCCVGPSGARVRYTGLQEIASMAPMHADGFVSSAKAMQAKKTQPYKTNTLRISIECSSLRPLPSSSILFPSLAGGSVLAAFARSTSARRWTGCAWSGVALWRTGRRRLRTMGPVVARKGGTTGSQGGFRALFFSQV